MRADLQKPLGLTALAVFSLPMVLVQAIEVAWRVYLPGFFAMSAGLSLALVGALLMAVRLFDSVVDPVIAWASDRFPTRHGHRRPWLAAGAPLIMLGALGVYFVWPWTGLTSLALSCLLLHLGYMMLVTPHGGWALELAGDAAERVRIIGAKTWFGVAGAILITTIPALLERGWGVGIRGQVAALGAILILLCPLSVLLILRIVPEPVLPRTRAAELANPLRLFTGILRTRALWPVLLLYLFTGVAESAGGVTFLFFTEDTLGLRGWGSSLLLLQMVAVLVTLPLWGKVAGRIGARPVLMMAYGWQLAVMPFAMLLPAGSLPLCIAFLLARGVFSGVDYLLLRTMVADVAREAAVAGLRHGASCYAISNITIKLAMGGGAWWALAMIDGGGAGTPGAADLSAQLVRAAYALPATVAGALGILVLAAGSARGRAAARRLVRRVRSGARSQPSFR